MDFAADSVNIVTPHWTGANGAPAAASRGIELRQLQQKLLHAVTANRDREAMLAAVALMVSEAISPVSLCFAFRDESHRLTLHSQLPGNDDAARANVSDELLLRVCQTACEQGEHQTPRFRNAETIIMATPISVHHQPPGAVAFVLPADTQSLDSITAVLQLVTAHVTLWSVLQESLRAESETRTFAAILELVGKLENAHDLRHACFTAVSELQQHLGCQRVALGLRQGHKQRCRLQAVSGTARFDKHSELVRGIEAALDEALMRDAPTVWPPASEADRHSTRAHQRLCSLADCTAIVTTPLRNERGETVGAWLVLGSRQIVERPETRTFLRACESPVGSCLQLLMRAQRGPLARATHAVWSHRKSWRGRAALVAMLLLAAVLAMPMPYKVGCDCKLQPVTRRFVAAPYDGTLEKSLVAPGDLVSRDQVMARLDGREIRWELAGLTADYNRAGKQRDAAMAAHNVPNAQQAKLEMERLELKIRLLEHRAENLEIKSPLNGIVVSGDLEKAEGAPLSIGQTLFEIAPLDQMIVEIAVPEEDVAYVKAGDEVVVRLDAYPERRWTGTVSKIHPRAEIREDRNVFVAELTFENPDRLLRPGMNGHAKVTGPRRPLAWNLFHKPWSWAVAALGW
jgi:biotin carboxyl carrier protein